MAAPVRPPLAQPGEIRTIVSWAKEIGDPVVAGEVVCEVETDKATVEIESQADGVMVAKLFEVGDEIPEDGPIALVGDAGEIDATAEDGCAKPATSAAESSDAPISMPEPASVAQPAPNPSGETAAPRHAAVSPRARKRAEDLSVALAGLAGSGPGGRIIERDVLDAAEALQAADIAAPAVAAAASVPLAEDRIIRVHGARRLVAERMHASLRDTAQLTMTSYADATRLLELRASFKSSDPQFGVYGITLNDLILFAVARTLPDHPEVNAICREGGDGLEIVQSAVVHLAFAVDTPRVLMVPVIRDASVLRVRDLSVRAADLVERCRGGSITPIELAGGTFTVSNLGAFGVESFTPILNSPQAAILGVGSVKWRPICEQEVQQQIALSLTIDHRLIDGAPAARFLQNLCARIAELDVLLAL